jgi:hypothetical protein
MAYFACSEAAKTGTDKATRASIAKGLVSPTYSYGGRQVLRGVVQADVVKGRDTGYVTASTAISRAKAAAAASRQAGETFATQVRKGVGGATAVPTQTATSTALHSSGAGQVGNTGVSALPKKTLMIGGVALLGIIYLVTR